ncbi:MAG: PKD domain-containing protein [Deltaproteobacteria bacterium]|nr:PKD domain-containing protein [Deltaproteobacteria bacterium]
MTYISRTPRYDYDAAKNTPAAGDIVTFTANVRSRGTSATGSFNYKWYIDGVEVSSGESSSISTGYSATFTISYTWQEGNHWISFFADPANSIAEKSEQNNLRNEPINALLVGFWVERSVYNQFDLYQYSYTQTYGIPDEANSWEDWAQRQVAKWNDMLKAAVFPSTPDGCFDRVRLDRVIIVNDGALPLNGGLPTNHPDTRDKTVDMMWGFEKDILSTGFYSRTTPNSPFNLEPGLIHELNHARYLVDSYALNIHGKHIAVLNESGVRIYPSNDTLVRVNSQDPSLMSNTVPWYGEWEAAGMNVYAGQRPLPGWANYNAHGGLGVYLDNKFPRNNYLRVVDAGGRPIAGAAIEVYQAGTWPGEWHWYCKYIDNTVDVTGMTDSQGLFNMGTNPFSRGEPLAWNFYYDVNFMKIKFDGQTHYAWLDIAQVHVEYFRGNTENAYFEVKLPINYEPNNPPTVSAGSDQTIALPAPAQLAGTATDDGKPSSPGTLTITWSKVSGPGSVTFTNPSTPRTEATFSTTGVYVLRLTASDGWATVSDDVSISVNPDPNAPVEITTAESATTYSYLGKDSSFRAQGQSFKAPGPYLVRLTAAFARSGNPYSDITVSIRTIPKGSDLATATIPRAAITSTSYTSPTWYTVEFPGGVPTTTGSTYWVVFSTTSTSYGNYFRVPISAGNPYTGGAWYKGTSLTPYYNYDMLLRFAFGSAQNNEPSQAAINEGVSSGYTGVPYAFSAAATDPDGDRILYVFDWGDGQTATTALINSGTAISAEHAWQSAGSYAVRVRAVDEHGKEGAWSGNYPVSIQVSTNNPPQTPVLSGPGSGDTGQSLTFTTTATDPDGDQIHLRVDWGDDTEDEYGIYASGTAISASHSWQTEGTYSVRAQVIDEQGAVSGWSTVKTVVISGASTEELVISDQPTSAWYFGSTYSRKQQAQSFKAIGTRITAVSIPLIRVGMPNFDIRVSIRTSRNGTNLATTQIHRAQVSSTDWRNPDWITATFSSPAQVTENAIYYLVLETLNYDSGHYYKIGYNDSNPYPDGVYFPDSSSSGSSSLDMCAKISFGD